MPVNERAKGGRFVPPDMTARRLALGSLEGLDPSLQRALEYGPDFPPIPLAGPHDWLANHAERGQTFDQFVASSPNLPRGKRRVIYLQPIGDFKGASAPAREDLVSYVEAYFGLPVRLMEGTDVDALGASSRVNADTKRRQIVTGDVLRWLRGRLPDDAYCLIGLTMEDLYPGPDWNFVFGQASLRGRVGVYSFVRYDPAFYGEETGPGTPDLVLRRSLKVMVHELGHMFGIEHCVHNLCVMNGSNHLSESDSRPLHLCPVCLRKVLHSVGTKPDTRYESLLRYYAERPALADDARWVRGRIKRIRSGP